MVVISSLAAAGVHAAVAPPHLREGLLVGIFFVACAAAQLVWGALAWQRRTPCRAVAGSPATSRCSLSGWSPAPSASRACGGPEPLGPWDLTCALWEVVVVVGCLRLRHETAATEPERGAPVHPFVLFWLVLSVLALGLLSISGAAA